MRQHSRKNTEVEPSGLDFGSQLYQLYSLGQVTHPSLGLNFHSCKMAWLRKLQNAQQHPWNAATCRAARMLVGQWRVCEAETSRLPGETLLLSRGQKAPSAVFSGALEPFPHGLSLKVATEAGERGFSGARGGAGQARRGRKLWGVGSPLFCPGSQPCLPPALCLCLSLNRKDCYLHKT